MKKLCRFAKRQMKISGVISEGHVLEKPVGTQDQTRTAQVVNHLWLNPNAQKI